MNSAYANRLAREERDRKHAAHRRQLEGKPRVPDHFCENEHCENPATIQVDVSENRHGDAKRRFCQTCHDAFCTGMQHGVMGEQARAKAVIGAGTRSSNCTNFCPSCGAGWDSPEAAAACCSTDAIAK